MDERSIQELASFQIDGASVLSLYLNVDPQRRTRDEYRLALRRLLEDVADQATAEDRARVERYVELEYNRQGKAIACFSCAAHNFWRAFSLPVARADRAFVSDRPYVKPLLEAAERYAVAVVHRAGARLFVFSMGALEEATALEGEEVKRHRAGGWAAQRYQRHEDATAQRNLREAVELTDAFCRQHKCEHLILGGTDINIAQFSDLLPQTLRERVVGRINVDVDAPATVVSERSAEVVQAYLAQREAALVEDLITTAAKGGAAITGLSDTLGALHDGRVHHLIVTEGYRAGAHRCQNCGFMAVEPMTTCSFCHGTMVHVPDAVDTLVRRAIRQGLEVTIVAPQPARGDWGQVGAFLRY